MNINIKIIKRKYDLYEIDRNLLDMFPGRTCFGCGKKFKLHDMVSIAFTDRGNKVFHIDCLRAVMEQSQELT